MSLSFVSKSIQTTTEDGSFVEKPVEGATDDAGVSGSHGDHRPLFEQLRSNQERRDAEEEEYQRSMMRGTLALDEEDEAHLISLRRQREREEMELRQQTDQELAAFRAARLDRFSTNAGATASDDAVVENESLETANEVFTSTSTAAAQLLPATVAPKAAPKPTLPVIIKRRKRGSSEVLEAPTSATETQPDSKNDPKKTRPDDDALPAQEAGAGIDGNAEGRAALPSAANSVKVEEAGGLGGLLAGYDSSSDEEE